MNPLNADVYAVEVLGGGAVGVRRSPRLSQQAMVHQMQAQMQAQMQMQMQLSKGLQRQRDLDEAILNRLTLITVFTGVLAVTAAADLVSKLLGPALCVLCIVVGAAMLAKARVQAAR